MRYETRDLLPYGSLVALGACVACDVGRSSNGSNSGGDGTVRIDPDDEGSDRDLGDGDLGPTPVDLHGQLRIQGAQMQNTDGEPVQLKGVSSMWLNWEEDGYAENPSALRWMRNNWNLTVIRASMGIEPTGAYLANPDKAVAQVERIVENAIAAGVYVIIDWHDHAAHEHEAQAVEFFSKMARAYGHEPNVLYEPYNEPLDVDWSSVVRPYHEAVIEAIRAEDPDNVVILGTPHWSQDVDVAAGDPVSADNVMYALHFYSCTHTQRGRAQVAYSRGLPMFVTEWGATHADGGTDGLLCLQQAATWLEWLDSRQIGWTAWKLDNCARDSSCILAPNAPVSGGWTSEYLNGHALFVRANMQADEEPTVPMQPQDAGDTGKTDAGGDAAARVDASPTDAGRGLDAGHGGG